MYQLETRFARINVLDTPSILGTFVATPAVALPAFAAAVPLALLLLMCRPLLQRKETPYCHDTQRFAFQTLLSNTKQQYYCCTPATTANTTVGKCVVHNATFWYMFVCMVFETFF